MVDFKIIAHRCRGFGEEENTLAALKKALASDVDEIEVDLQITKDRELVVWHDWSYHTMSGKRVRISTTTLKQAEQSGLMSCATLLKTFKRKGKGKLLNIDIKKYGEEDQLVAMIRKYKLQDRVVIVSWTARCLEKVHKQAHAWKLAYTIVPKVYTKKTNGFPIRPAILLPAFIRNQTVPLDRVNLRHVGLPVTASIVRRLKKFVPEVIVVNEDTVKGNNRLIKIGVAASMTNNSPELLEHFKA